MQSFHEYQPIFRLPPNDAASEWKTWHRRGLAALILLSFFWWGGRSLWGSSEGRYGEVAREMVQDGNWLVPHLSGVPHLTKPPLTYWVAGGSMKLFGINTWAVKLPLCFAFAGAVLALCGLARAMGFTQREAFCAAVVYATSAYSYVGGHVFTTDPFLAFWVTAAMCGLWRSWRNPTLPNLALFWLGYGMAFLTKGYPAWLHLVPILVFWLIRRRRDALPSLRSYFGIPAMLALGLSWYLVLAARDHSLIAYWIKGEGIDRVATDKFNRQGPFIQYFLLLIFGVFPWVFLWLPAGLLSASSWKGGIRRALATMPGWLLFCQLWIVLPLIVFCVSRSRLPLYVLPLMPPVCLLLGKCLPAVLERAAAWSPRLQRTAAAALLLWALVLAFASNATPEQVAPEKGNQTDAQILEPQLKRIPRETHIQWTLANPQESLAFYLNRTLGDAGLRHTRDLMQHQAAQLAAHNRALYITRRHEKRLLDKRQIPYSIVADSPDYFVFEISPGS